MTNLFSDASSSQTSALASSSRTQPQINLLGTQTLLSFSHKVSLHVRGQLFGFLDDVAWLLEFEYNGVSSWIWLTVNRPEYFLENYALLLQIDRHVFKDFP